MYAIHPMTLEAARDIVTWRYPPPYAIYDPGADETTIAFFLDPMNRYSVVRDGAGELVGYCCCGADATVPGGDYSDEDALDIGIGMKPALTGQGRGHAFVGAVIDFGMVQFAPNKLRVTIAQFNRRSQRTFEGWGFAPVQHFVSTTETPHAFVVLVRGVAQRLET